MQRLITFTGRFLLVLVLVFPISFVNAAPVPNLTDSTPVTGQWLIKVDDHADPRNVAELAGAQYVGPLKGVTGYHRVRFLEQLKAGPDVDLTEQIARNLEAQSQIQKFEQEQLIVRYPKVFNPTDPLFPDQWHHENVGQTGGLPYADIAVRPVWDQGIKGTGVVVGVIDTGIEYTHPDLQGNWLVGSGYDYNDDDTDPSPVGNDDRHGTSVAGITLAAANSTGGLGIAPSAKLVPLRLIAGPFATGDEAQALSHRKQEIDIYNNSWGPSDDAGVRYAQASTVMQDAVRDNVASGRSGLGNIYVWAAGNGGLNGDNSNFDGYNSLPYTISVGAVGHDDIKAGYSEPGANLLVVAPSGGRGAGIVTTDNTGVSGYSDGNDYDNFSGTSAAAPMVSGVVALMLDARPNLNWRDVQQILARTAVPVDFSEEKWVQNGAGLWISHDYGFGRVDAHAALQLTSDWVSLNPMLPSFTGYQSKQAILNDNQTVSGQIYVSSTMEVQFARVRVQLNHSDWGDIAIELESPQGTTRTLAVPHANANTSGEPGSWTYLSTQHLGEIAQGTWKLRVTDSGSGGSGTWTDWRIELMGHTVAPGANRNPVGEDLSINSVYYPVTIEALSGMSDPDGDPLEILSVQNPRYGTLIDKGNGIFDYRMGVSKDGTDTFSVLIGDGRGGAKRRLVRILDPRPVCINDMYTIKTGTTVNLPVLSNDKDPDGDPLQLVLVRGDFSEYATIVNGESIQFESPPNLTGVIRMQYQAKDASDGSSSGWITLVIEDSPDIAMRFDGEDDFMRLAPTTQLSMNDNFTAEAWIFPQSYGEYVTGFGRIYDRDTFVFFLNGFDHSFYNDRSLVLYVITSDGRPHAINSSANTIDLNRWQHVAVTYNSSDISNPVRLYVDGQPVGISYPPEVTTLKPTLPIRDNRPWSLYIGESDTGARAFRGRMAEFRIWNQVLSSSTISLQHDQRMTGNETGLQLYLPLTQTLEPVAYSTGAFQGSLEIYEAQRTPFNLPWEEFLSYYTTTYDLGNGWWYDRTIGWIFGDDFPWVYSLRYGWIYTGHEAGSNDLQLFFESNNWGWMQTSESLFPWFNRPSDGKWLWYLEGTYNPVKFYDPGSSNWLNF